MVVTSYSVLQKFDLFCSAFLLEEDCIVKCLIEYSQLVIPLLEFGKLKLRSPVPKSISFGPPGLVRHSCTAKMVRGSIICQWPRDLNPFFQCQAFSVKTARNYLAVAVGCLTMPLTVVIDFMPVFARNWAGICSHASRKVVG